MPPEVESPERDVAPERLLSPPAGGLRSLFHVLSCIRFDEVLLLQGSPLLGVVFSAGGLPREAFADLVVFTSGSFCLVAHVFALNDWFGMDTDFRDTNRSGHVLQTHGVGRKRIRNLWIALLAISLLLFSFNGSQTVSLAAAIAGASALYSAPPFYVKGIPFLSSTLHLIGGLLYFLLGYSLFRPLDGRSVEIGCFFALVFAAGHLTHEARDWDADRLNGIKTTAVTYGRTSSFVAGIVLFTIADSLLFLLAARGIVPRALVLAVVPCAVHIYWSLRTLRAGLHFGSIRRLQVRYHALYAIVGLTMVATVLA